MVHRLSEADQLVLGDDGVCGLGFGGDGHPAQLEAGKPVAPDQIRIQRTAGRHPKWAVVEKPTE